jgi:hypothetical protein
VRSNALKLNLSALAALNAACVKPLQRLVKCRERSACRSTARWGVGTPVRPLQGLAALDGETALAPDEPQLRRRHDTRAAQVFSRGSLLTRKPSHEEAFSRGSLLTRKPPRQQNGRGWPRPQASRRTALLRRRLPSPPRRSAPPPGPSRKLAPRSAGRARARPRTRRRALRG